MDSTEKRILGMACFGHVMVHIYEISFAGLFGVIARSLDMPLTSIGFVGSIGYLLYGLGALPAGLLATRTNAKFTLRLFFILSALASLVTGLSRSLTGLGFGLGFLGLALSLYHVSGLTLITQGVRVKGRALGIHGIAGSLGITLAPLICMPIAEAWGWRMAYLVIAVPGLAGFVLLMLDRRIPKAHIIPKAEKEESSTGAKGLTLFILAVIIMGVNGFVYRGYLTALPSFMKQVFPNTAEVSGFLRYFKHGLIATAILGTGMIGQYLGGYFSDRIRMSRLYSAILTAGLPFLVLMGMTSSAPLVVISVLFTIIHFSGQPVENNMISAFSPPRIVSSAYGVKFILTFGLGSFGASFAAWIAGDARMYARVFPALGFVLIIAVAASVLLAVLDAKQAGRQMTENNNV